MIYIQLVIVLLLAMAVGVLIKIENNLKQNKSLENSSADVHEEFFSDYELQVMQRNQSFDERIAALKEELALHTTSNNADVRGINFDTGIPAQELHPGVKNIPHSAVRINGYNSLPDVEYTE